MSRFTPRSLSGTFRRLAGRNNPGGLDGLAGSDPAAIIARQVRAQQQDPRPGLAPHPYVVAVPRGVEVQWRRGDGRPSVYAPVLFPSRQAARAALRAAGVAGQVLDGYGLALPVAPRGPFVVVYRNDLLRSGGARGPYPTLAEADAAAQLEASRSRRFVSYQVYRGTPANYDSRKPLSPEYRGVH